ncbi:MAG TPA: CPBP family intramembrane glutamic endopeptidase [Gemmatimonadales bacterium]|nr:CPBP family intramembrane glutamic endopeptidase [Gemmatimonadales bacterium]
MDDRRQPPALLSRISAWVRGHPGLAFVLLAYGFTWLLWTPVGLFARVDNGTEIMLMLVGGWGPALAAIALSRTGNAVAGDRPGRKLRVGLFAGAAVIGLLVLIWRFGGGGKDVLTDGPGAGQGTFSGLPLLSVVIATGVFAFVISRLRSPDSGVRSLMAGLVRWRVAPVYYAFALLVLPAVAIAGVVLAKLLGQPIQPPAIAGHPWQVWIPAVLSSFLLTVLFTGGVCEELGWRGFLLPRLQQRFSPLSASLILAPIWTFWHLPLFLTGIRPLAALLPFFAMGILLSILFTWLFNRTGGSVLLVVLLHAAVNNHAVLVPRAGYPTMAAGVLLVVGLVILDRMHRRIPERLPQPAPAAVRPRVG